MKIVCDDKIPFLRGVLEPFAQVVYLPGKQTTPEIVRDADAIITRTRTKCDAALLAGSRVKVIATATIGFDHIDTAWCEANGIRWYNAPGCNSWSVKQYISSVLVSLASRRGLDLSRMTLGVVGVGNVGSKVAEAASLLGMKVLLNDPPRQRAGDCPPALGYHPERSEWISLDELMERSDIVTLHVPLTKEGEDATWHLFDAARIARLRPDQFLFNSSRGPVVDNAALRDALKAKALRGAVLDVWEGEPDIDRELMGLLDFSTPHIAGYSADGKANGTTMSVRAVAAVLGLPLLDWTASGVPAPAQSLRFSIDAVGKTDAQVLAEAILHTYEVQRDTDALRSAPELFEKLRGDYPVRREPTAFSLQLKGGTAAQAETLSRFGFNLINQIN